MLNLVDSLPKIIGGLGLFTSVSCTSCYFFDASTVLSESAIACLRNMSGVMYKASVDVGVSDFVLIYLFLKTFHFSGKKISSRPFISNEQPFIPNIIFVV